MDLLKGLENRDHNVYVDNFYSSLLLFKDLQKVGIGACGTVRIDRKGIPVIFKSTLQKGEVRTRRLDGGVLALQWQDKRTVSMLSTIHDAGMSTIQRRTRQVQGGIEQIQKPTMVVEYNKHMGGVDQADQMLSYYGFTHRTVKWWRRAFFHLLNVSVLNAYILYQQQQVKKCTHEQFQIELARQLLVKYGGQTPASLSSPQSSLLPTSSRLTGRHFPERTPDANNGRPTQSQCRVCCWRKGRKRVTTTYRCKQCQVPLCVVPCFELYHTHSDPTRYLQ